MKFFFRSEGCPGCFFAEKILEERMRKAENDTGSVQIVNVKFDEETKQFVTYIDDRDTGPSPVSTVPAWFDDETKELITGADEVIEVIRNASW